MFGFFASIGVWVKDLILRFANLLVSHDAAPGWVAIGLVLMALFFLMRTWRLYSQRFEAIRNLRAELSKEGDSLLNRRDSITAWFGRQKNKKENKALAKAWKMFDKTLFIDDTKGEPFLISSVRPSVFFNVDDLRFGTGFVRILPGVLISVGLTFTFLGLIAALADMSKGEINSMTMSNLIGIASAKFIMSLTGLACSIVITIFLKYFTGKMDKALHDLSTDLEQGTQFASLEQIGIDQLRAMVEDREHHRLLTLQMIAEIGGPLKNELPQTISSSIATAMQPILELTTKQSTESLSTLASDLSQQVSEGVGDALTLASERLAQAGDRIGQLADRMDQSSGRMGNEMEGAISRVAQAVDELRNAMSVTATETSGAFTQGAESLLTAMSSTLESIRDNTSEGAKAIAVAASEMREAAGAMRQEMEVAARHGADAAKSHIQAAGVQAEEAMGEAGHSMLKAFEKSSTDIVAMTQSLSSNASETLIKPINAIVGKIGDMTNTLADGATEMRRMVDAVRDGAKAGSDASMSFRSASQELVSAVMPVRGAGERMEMAMRQLVDGTNNAVAVVTQSSSATAEAAAHTLATAKETLAAERHGIDATLAAVSGMLERMKGQGDRMDTIDDKLGRAFDLYANQTEQAMQTIRSHVQEMSSGLNKALDTLQTILDGLQEFQPQQRRS